jgi:hypothetical protein
MFIDIVLTSLGVGNGASAQGWSGGAEKLAYHSSDRHHGRFRIASPLRRACHKCPENLVAFQDPFSRFVEQWRGLQIFHCSRRKIGLIHLFFLARPLIPLSIAAPANLGMEGLFARVQGRIGAGSVKEVLGSKCVF